MERGEAKLYGKQAWNMGSIPLNIFRPNFQPFGRDLWNFPNLCENLHSKLSD